jgi:hypothetical protein
VIKSGSEKQRRRCELIQSNKTLNKSIEPQGGWNSFEQYLRKKIDSLEKNDNGKNYNENIRLQFKIDELGRPVEIKPEGESDSLTVEKAIQILTNGPKWTNKKSNRNAKLIIPFK